MIHHPYALENGRWLRGNLHSHTTRSDGTSSPQAVIDAYADLEYDFLMFSDHDLLTSIADYGAWDPHDMIMIPGNEITAGGPHMLHVGARQLVAPTPNRQEVVDAIAASGGIAIMNHPNWEERFDHCPIEQLSTLSGYAGLEIFNGVIGFLHGSPYATNKWDMLLSAGRRVWGFANDDSHHLPENLGLGWNMAFVSDPSPAGVVDALANGRFYASTGVEITGIQVTENRIQIETTNARKIVALRETGRRFAQTDNSAIDVEFPEGASYVRFECWGDGEQFAWTQPFWPDAPTKHA